MATDPQPIQREAPSSSEMIGDVIWNVPNTLSMARLVLSVLTFVLLAVGSYWAGLIGFLIAALTDWIDGWWARRFQQVTKLGRMLDPFCDKILICGVYILVAEAMADYPWYARIAGWMAVAVVARELLVTVLRGLIEQSGGDFSAKMHGKIKMWLQCIAATAALVTLARFGTPETTPTAWCVLVGITAWVAVASTLYSGWLYVKLAGRALLQGSTSSAAP
jgi:CDP-diacylglycerol--glycerol-3-phosphate 3-phosphatidyltransferase